jgi:hypothetical protein
VFIQERVLVLAWVLQMALAQVMAAVVVAVYRRDKLDLHTGTTVCHKFLVVVEEDLEPREEPVVVSYNLIYLRPLLLKVIY